jgi:hypothetical protein
MKTAELLGPGGRRTGNGSLSIACAADRHGLLIANHNNSVPVGLFIIARAVVSPIAIAFFRDRSVGELDAI